MKKYFFIIFLIFVILCSCSASEKNVIVDNNVCIYNNCEYDLISNDPQYRIIGPKRVVGYIRTLYGGYRELYISDFDINDIIIYDEAYHELWVKKGIELPTFVSSDITGFYLVYEYCDDTLVDDDTLMIKIPQSSFLEIFNLFASDKDDMVAVEGYTMIRDNRYYFLYLKLNDYLCCSIGNIYFMGENIYIEYEDKIYQINEEYTHYIYDNINS